MVKELKESIGRWKEEIKDVENNRNEPDNSYEKPQYIQPKQHIHVG